MGERNASPRSEEVRRTLQHSLELELSHVRALHASNADALKEAFSPAVKKLLRNFSGEESFFQYSPISTELSSETSSRTTDFSETPPRDDSPTSSDSESTDDQWDTIRSIFKFLYEEFMPAPTDQQMEIFYNFLDRVKETASRIRLPSGASFGPHQIAAARKCVTMARTMRDLMGSNFTSLPNYFKARTNKDPAQSTSDTGASSSSDISQTGEHVPNLDRSGGAHQNVPARTETIIRYCGVRNPEVTRLIDQNTTHATGNTGLAGQETIGSVARTMVDRYEGSSPPRKRPPLQRQDHVMEEDNEVMDEEPNVSGRVAR